MRDGVEFEKQRKLLVAQAFLYHAMKSLPTGYADIMTEIVISINNIASEIDEVFEHNPLVDAQLGTSQWDRGLREIERMYWTE